MVESLAGMRQGNRNKCVRFLALTVLGGICFLSLQAYEWTHLIEHGQSIQKNNFGATFFMLTGFHGCHVFGGVVYLSFVLAKAMQGGYSATNFAGVETVGLYWHFVDLVWILVFTFVYLL